MQLLIIIPQHMKKSVSHILYGKKGHDLFGGFLQAMRHGYGMSLLYNN